MSERGKDPLDVILSMGKVSSEAPFYNIELEITGGGQVGFRVQLEAARMYPAGPNRFMIVERRKNEQSGEYENVPRLATYRPESDLDNLQLSPDNVARALRGSRKRKGTKRTGLGHGDS